MGKLLTTLKYGSAKTKAFLILIFVLLAGGATLSVYGISNFRLWALAVGGIMLICGLILIFAANFSTEQVSPKETEQDSAPQPEKGNKTPQKPTLREDGTLDFGVLDEDEPEETSEIGRKRTAEEKNQKKNNPNNTISEQNVVQNGNKSDRIGYGSTDTVHTDNLSRYTASEFKKTLRRYKVKRHFTPIIIDDCHSFGTSHTPALVWVTKNTVNFLLMEDNERVTTMPLERFLDVRYEQNVNEDDIESYDRIRNELGVYEMFADVMPTFTSGTNRLGMSNYRKNRYILGRDTAITPKSLKALRENFRFKLNIFDSLNISGEFSRYFKGAYEARVLWTDGVIGQQEYQNRISGILQSMVDDRELIRYDFVDDLERMVRYRLITNEYADYYNAQRQKRDNNPRNNRR